LLDEHTAALDPKTAEQVLHLTDKLVAQNNLTTFMITHNMQDALTYGNRLIMLHHGQIVVDLQGHEKEQASVNDLIELFKENSGQKVEDEGMLLGV
jgi:putative ABC transport system ATP-binding protein